MSVKINFHVSVSVSVVASVRVGASKIIGANNRFIVRDCVSVRVSVFVSNYMAETSG